MEERLILLDHVFELLLFASLFGSNVFESLLTWQLLTRQLGLSQSFLKTFVGFLNFALSMTIDLLHYIMTSIDFN